jgi:PST family polysaccharide transporter
MAPLLHLGAFGLLFDSANQIGGTMLRRAMDFRRFRIIYAVGTLTSVVVTLVVGLAGGGAYAIVLGSNVVTGLPFAVDLLLVRRWRPTARWWRWPNWSAYRPALAFGVQQAGSALLSSLRGALESVVLPAAIGYHAIGLFNRAQALVGMSVGRVAGVLAETVYPVLPRYAAVRDQYASAATLFLQVLCLLALPGALFVGLEGADLSRVLYGEKWLDADPIILPAALIGLGQAVFLGALSVLLAANRLRACLVMNAVTAAFVAPMVVVAWAGRGLVGYAWALAAGQLLAAVTALVQARAVLAPGWAWTALGPTAVSALAAMGVVLATKNLWAGQPTLLRLAISATVYAVVVGATLRALFGEALAALLRQLPGGSRVGVWLRLPGGPGVAVVPGQRW